MQNAEFANSTQTTIFYIQALVQIWYFTSPYRPQLWRNRSL